MRSAICAALMVGLMVAGNVQAWAAGGTIGSIHGHVIDATTKAPVADANVSASSPSGNFKATTDSHGFFALIGLPSDTYTMAISKQGYQSVTLTGETVIGDENVDIGTISVTAAKVLSTVLVTGHGNSAYQPKGTQDTTTISGARIVQSLGNTQAVNEEALVLTAPGAVQDVQGNVSIRGSLTVEVSNQFDGVPFDAPFFDENGSQGYLNNIAGGTGGGVQVVSGAGDATQGNVGAGLINVIPGRGTYPSHGEMDAEVRSPYYEHAFNFNYGFATPDNRFSDYVALSSSRYVPEYAPFGVDASSVGQFNGTSYATHDDILNNFYYKFGKDQHMQFQALVRWADIVALGNYGGLQNAQWYSNPNDPNYQGFWEGSLGLFPACGAGVANCFTQVVTYLPNVPPPGTAPVTQPEITSYQPMHFMKLGFSDRFSDTTNLNVAFFNWGLVQGNTNYTTDAFLFPGPSYTQIGGYHVGGTAELTHQFGESHNTTLALKLDDQFPLWENGDAATGLYMLSFIGGYQNQGIREPSFVDWYTPQNLGQPVSASNPCVGPYIPAGAVTSPTDPSGCWIYDQLLAKGLWKGVMPRIPTFGISYHHSLFQEEGAGLRDQWSVNDKLKLDYGIRVDAANYKFGPNPWALNPYSDPSDVNPINQIGDAFSHPRFWEPRFAAAYQFGTNDSLRLSYARSVEFFFAQTAGTPADMAPAYLNPLLAQIAPKNCDGAGSGCTVDQQSEPSCGSGWHGPGAGYIAYSGNPYANTNQAYFFPCTSYAQQLFWMYDQNFDAPDLGGNGPPTYNDYDMEWAHRFAGGKLSGWGMKLGAFARRGYNVEQNTLIANAPPNPVTGQTSASVFATRANGVEKDTGIEFMLTTPDVRYGLSGYVSATYQNELLNTPPVATGGLLPSDSLPILNAFLLDTPLLFHSGFTPPLAGQAGATYTFRDGLRITPSVTFNTGYPFGVGKTSVGFVDGQLVTIPSTNFGIGVPFAGALGPGNPYNAEYYVDPAYPGSYFNPNVAASRGYGEPALAGQNLTRPAGFLNLDVEAPLRNGLTVGAQVFNVFNNHNGVPYVNTAWQPVATGVGGPQTGTYTGAYPGSAQYDAGARDEFGLAGGQLPFEPGYNPGTVYNFYIQTKF